VSFQDAIPLKFKRRFLFSKITTTKLEKNPKLKQKVLEFLLKLQICFVCYSEERSGESEILIHSKNELI
jgi:hypothetical protein